jgi:hypothetical protein
LAAMRVLGGPAGRRRAERRVGGSGVKISMASGSALFALGLAAALPALAFGIGGGSLDPVGSVPIESVGAPVDEVEDAGLVRASIALDGGSAEAGPGDDGLGAGPGKDGPGDASGSAADKGLEVDEGSAGGLEAAAPPPGASVTFCGWVLTAPDPTADFFS